jgi:hypothetical protein
LAPLPILWFADSQSLGVNTDTGVWSDQGAKVACVKADRRDVFTMAGSR